MIGRRLITLLPACLLWGAACLAHEHTLTVAQTNLAQIQRTDAVAKDRSCSLTLHLRDAVTGESLPGLVRVSPQAREAPPLALEGLFERPAGWFSMPAGATIPLPPGRWRVEAVHGTETEVAVREIELAQGGGPSLDLPLKRFFDPRAAGLRSGNTHLHLIVDAHRKMGVLLRARQEADDYLQTVGHSDGLDLVYVSYLTRPGEPYISNEYTDTDLVRFSSSGRTLFGNGIEHRHGGALKPGQGPSTPGSSVVMSYGHVMLLDLDKRSVQASIGPGLSENPRDTDGTPLRHGIIQARNQGAGIIWCHGTQGLEDIPNWVAGLIHAQNIYDGGNEGDFDAVFYPYLNSGFKVPFSTGTDWGVTDFSRVYVTAPEGLSSRIFRRELEKGRTFITNEPFLAFRAGSAVPGDTVTLPRAGDLRIRGRAIGRSDFVRLQVVYNGAVVHETPSRPVAGHHEATIDFTLSANKSGWLALRIPTVKAYEYRSNYSGPGTNILGKAIFAHTSPVYLSVAGQPTFDAGAVEHLLRQVRLARQTVDKVGVFAGDAEREGVLMIYREAETALTSLLESKGRRRMEPK